MESRYLRLKEIHRELLRQGREEEAFKVLSSIRALVATGQVTKKELEAGFYL